MYVILTPFGATLVGASGQALWAADVSEGGLPAAARSES